MDETSFLPEIIAAIHGGLGIFLKYIDWGFFLAIFLVVMLSNILLPPWPSIPKAFQWFSRHRYRVPVLAMITAVVFAVLRDYGTYNRVLWFTYTMTMMFAMVMNTWFLDIPATKLAEKYPSMKLLFKGRDPIPPCD